jgi:hypothetical protein
MSETWPTSLPDPHASSALDQRWRLDRARGTRPHPRAATAEGSTGDHEVQIAERVHRVGQERAAGRHTSDAGIELERRQCAL